MAMVVASIGETHAPRTPCGGAGGAAHVPGTPDARRHAHWGSVGMDAAVVTVPGTALRYLANTVAKAFREPTDDEWYVQVDGRWYRAWTSDGPWQGIADKELPADIASHTAR